MLQKMCTTCLLAGAILMAGCGEQTTQQTTPASPAISQPGTTAAAPGEVKATGSFAVAPPYVKDPNAPNTDTTPPPMTKETEQMKKRGEVVRKQSGGQSH